MKPLRTRLQEARKRCEAAARAVLGQRSLKVAELYGEIDAALAADTARKVG